MDGFLLFFLKSIPPLIYIGVLLPLLTAIILWFGFYNNHHKKNLKPTIKALKKAISAGEGMETPDKGNALLMEEATGDFATPKIISAWKKVGRDIAKINNDGFISEAEAYFSCDSIVKKPSGREYLPSLFKIIGILATLSISMPLVVSLLFFPSLAWGAITLGILSFTLICLGQGIFVFYDSIVYGEAMGALERFIEEFNRIIPVAGSLDGPSLLIDATNSNKEAFIQAADRIENAFDSFVNEAVIPALQQSSRTLIRDTLAPSLSEIKNSLNQAMDAFSRRHETEMKFMTEAFITRLTDTVEKRMHALGDSLQIVEKGILAVNEELGNNLTGTKEMIKEQVLLLTKAGQLSVSTMDAQEQIREIHISMDEQAKASRIIMERFENNTAKLIDEVLKVSSDTGQLQQNLTENIENITKAMNEAVIDAGKELGKGLMQVTEDNSSAITNLTVLSGSLKDEYDNYFDRIENSTRENLEDMDYHMQNVIAKVTGEVETMLKEMLEQNRDILSQYKSSTRDMVQSFEEQSRSIGLYAKEMNFDINLLSESMRTIIEDFTSGVENSVKITMGTFDSGLAELSHRIANTVESISDAVENLPKAIGRNS